MIITETREEDRADGKEHYLGGHHHLEAEGDEMNAKYWDRMYKDIPGSIDLNGYLRSK